MSICVIIPALNEEGSIGEVVRTAWAFADRVLVVDNGSSDDTASAARIAGADIVREPKRGYGRSCLAGVRAAGEADIFVFLDGDGADDPRDWPRLVGPIQRGDADFVVGARLSGAAEPGALTLPQKFGNALACFLMRRLWGGPFTDLGPFRAIRRGAYERLGMSAETFGWTVEMQARALRKGLVCMETNVAYRKRRVGKSKVSGNICGVVLAGAHILGVIAREAALDVIERHGNRARQTLRTPPPRLVSKPGPGPD